MRKIFTLLNMITVLSLCTMFTACDDDADEAMVLRGEWTGRWGMYYTTHLGHTFEADQTDIVFYTAGDSYTNRGYGYQVDWYSVGPYTRLYSRFTWRIDNGIIKIHYPDDYRYDTRIYDYHLNEAHFTGYFDDSDAWFELFKLHNYDWSYYYSYGDSYYWENTAYYWEYGDYYAYAKTRGTANADSTASVNTPYEPERIVKIGSRLAEKTR